jgi:hypothetical protein
MKRTLALLAVLLAPVAAQSDTYPRQPGIDAIHWVLMEPPQFSKR